MAENFMDMAKKIEQRELALISALEREAKAIDQAETKLGQHYQESVKNAYNLSLNSMQEQERELENELESMNTNIAKQTQETYKVLSGNLKSIQSKAQQSQNIMTKIVSQKIKSTIWLNLSFLFIGIFLGGVLIYLLNPKPLELKKGLMILDPNPNALKYQKESKAYYYWLTKEESLKMRLSIEEKKRSK